MNYISAIIEMNKEDIAFVLGMLAMCIVYLDLWRKKR